MKSMSHVPNLTGMDKANNSFHGGYPSIISIGALPRSAMRGYIGIYGFFFRSASKSIY